MRIRKTFYYFAILGALYLSESRCQSEKYWIFFKEKDGSALHRNTHRAGIEYLKDMSEYVNQRALTRRSKILPPDSLLDGADRPLYEPYLERISEMGGKLVQKSRWLNAASFILTPSVKKTITALPFIWKIEPVKIFRGKRVYSTDGLLSMPFRKNTVLDYGPSYDQLNMANIIQLHDAGITGRRVLIGMLDSGYRWKLHEALQDRRVIGEYDFIFKDDNTANESGDPQIEDSHGTLTFSVIGGYKSGKLIGAAFDSEFLLAKTEYDSTEFQTEEDFFAAGIEWLEGQGADVVSSSIGYDLFDDWTGYFWENGDFDGKTSITARAVARAARLGVVVCTTMGNEGNGNGIEGTMITPADADSIISVGAVTSDGRLAIFSSTGPTNDDRIKPDVVAPGVNIYHASVPGPDTYGRTQGTSLATPLTAGASALLLSVRPELSPVQVRDILRATAAPIDTGAHRPVPNNFTGWGIVDAFQAAVSVGPVFSNQPLGYMIGDRAVLTTYVFSKYGINPDSTLLFFSAGTDQAWTRTQMKLDSTIKFPTSGKYSASLPLLEAGVPVRFYIVSRDSAGNSYTSPSPIYLPYWIYYYGDNLVRETDPLPTKITLEQNFPNPFNSGTWLKYSLPLRQSVSLKVYNIIGQLVAVILDGSGEAGGNFPEFVYFDASDLPSGVYFYRLTTQNYALTKKMMLIR